MRRWAIQIGLFAVLVAAVAGCGGDSSETVNAASESAKPLPKAVFVKRASDICEKAHESYIDAAFRALGEAQQENPGASQKDLEEEVTKRYYGKAFDKEVEELRGLGIPKGDQKEVEEFLETLEAALTRAKEEPNVFFKELFEFKRPFRKATHLANSYGIDPCGQP